MWSGVLGAALATCLLVAGVSAGPAQGTPASAAEVARGRYIFGATGGCAATRCPEGSRSTAGGRRYDGPFGTVYSQRTSRRTARPGSGRGPDEQIITAIRLGASAQRRASAPGAPVHGLQRNGRGGSEARSWRSCVPMPPVNRATPAEEDHRAAVRERVPPDLAGVRAMRDATADSAARRRGCRGEYLVRAVWSLRRVPHATHHDDGDRQLAASWPATREGAGGSGECRTSRRIRETGLGKWSGGGDRRATSGPATSRTATSAGGLDGAEVIDGTARRLQDDLTQADRVAIAQYLEVDSRRSATRSGSSAPAGRHDPRALTRRRDETPRAMLCVTALMVTSLAVVGMTSVRVGEADVGRPTRSRKRKAPLLKEQGKAWKDIQDKTKAGDMDRGVDAGRREAGPDLHADRRSLFPEGSLRSRQVGRQARDLAEEGRSSTPRPRTSRRGR